VTDHILYRFGRMRGTTILLCAFLFIGAFRAQAQVEEDRTGAWYMTFWRIDTLFGAFGLQGDVQFRNWDLGGDLEQLLLRGGVTYTPQDFRGTFTLGYAHVTSGAPGASDAVTNEHRMYQEALLPHHPGGRLFLSHRFRLEERFVQDQDLRTRVRYALFLNIPLTGPRLEPRTTYLALYDELFVNGERGIGEDRSVELFDRNRAYAAIGHVLGEHGRVQAGAMLQTTASWRKPQVQISLHLAY